MKRFRLVEDYGDNRTLLEHAGSAVRECTDGESAIRCARESRPDVIPTGIALPCSP